MVETKNAFSMIDGTIFVLNDQFIGGARCKL